MVLAHHTVCRPTNLSLDWVDLLGRAKTVSLRFALAPGEHRLTADDRHKRLGHDAARPESALGLIDK
jgi:hypothetical protein